MTGTYTYFMQVSTVSARYATNTTDPLYLQGKIALLQESTARFKEVLYSALQVFQELNVECSEYLEVNDDYADKLELSVLQESDSEYVDSSEFSDCDEM